MQKAANRRLHWQDRPLDKGGRHACGSRVKQKQEQDRCYRAAQHLREAESLSRTVRSARGRSPLGGQGIRVPDSVSGPGGGNVAVVMGDVRRPRPRCRRGHGHVADSEEVGIAPVGREEPIMLQHRAGSQRMAQGGASSGPVAWAHPGGHRRNMARVCRGMGGGAAWPAGVLGQGWECGRSHGIAKCNAKG